MRWDIPDDLGHGGLIDVAGLIGPGAQAQSLGPSGLAVGLAPDDSTACSGWENVSGHGSSRHSTRVAHAGVGTRSLRCRANRAAMTAVPGGGVAGYGVSPSVSTTATSGRGRSPSTARKPVQWADRIDQHQDPTPHPDGVRLQVRRGPDRFPTHPRRPPTRPPRPKMTHSLVRRAENLSIRRLPRADSDRSSVNGLDRAHVTRHPSRRTTRCALLTTVRRSDPSNSWCSWPSTIAACFALAGLPRYSPRPSSSRVFSHSRFSASLI